MGSTFFLGGWLIVWSNVYHFCFSLTDLGKVYYLTIQETWVEPGDSQRRPGLHVDSPGKVKIKGEDLTQELNQNKGNGKSQEYTGHCWGNGCAHYVKPQSECDGHNEMLLTMQVS